MKTNAITVDLHIYSRIAMFGEISNHTRIDIARKINQVLIELGSEHEFLSTIPIVEIIGRDDEADQ